MNSLNPGAVWLPLQEERVRLASRELLGVEARGATPEALDSARLLSEVRAARTRLEQQLHLLTVRVEQARRLEAALEQAQEP